MNTRMVEILKIRLEAKIHINPGTSIIPIPQEYAKIKVPNDIMPIVENILIKI